jgi:hypothetical protein
LWCKILQSWRLIVGLATGYLLWRNFSQRCCYIRKCNKRLALCLAKAVVFFQKLWNLNRKCCKHASRQERGAFEKSS